MVSFYGMYTTRFGYKNNFSNFIKVGVRQLIPPWFYRNQIYWLLDNNDKILVQKIYRFEQLNEFVWADICKNVGITDDFKNTHKSSYKKQSYHYYYDNTTRQIVAKWYQQDIDYFGFVFD